MKPKLTLIRGLPGSGKSTLARKIAIGTGVLHVEADMWIDYSHRYEPEVVKRAHAICQSQALRALQYEAQVEIITATGDYGSVHGVPESAIQAMRERWEEVAV
jgi:adenylate kinase family enzyme